MINLGLSAREQIAFEAALAEGHRIDIQIAITDLDHNHISDVSDRLVDGQVNVDQMAETSRSCTLSLLDPDHGVGFDSDDPTDGQWFLDRMVKVEYGVEVKSLDRWVYVPVFHGPIVAVSRDAHTVEVEAYGKDHLARTAIWKPISYSHGTRVNVIRGILRSVGESKFDFPRWRARIASPVSLGRKSIPWRQARLLAISMRSQVFYDGRGFCRLRKHSMNNLFVYRDGDGGTVLTQPQAAVDGDAVVNTVHVIGGVPKGAKTPVEAYAYIPKSHPRSPTRLRRGGRYDYRPEIIEDDTIRTKKEAEEAAERRIREILVDEMEITFDALPVPHLEPGDLVRLQAGGINTPFRLRKYTIPLSHSGVSTIGYLRRVAYKGKVRSRVFRG